MSEFQNDPPLDSPESVAKRTGFWHRIRSYFLAGVLVTSPIAVTLALALWLINFVDSHIVPLIPEQWNPDTYLRGLLGVEFSIPGTGVVILFVLITLIGWVAASYFGRIFVRIGENIVARMPIVRGIYGAVKQIMETIFRNQSQAFRRAVLVEYPRRGLWTVAFVTGTAEGEVKSLIANDLVNIYVPTTPNPTSGFLLFVPKEDVIYLDMTVEEAFKLVISGGLVVPPDRRPEAQRKIAAACAQPEQPAPPKVANLSGD